MPQDVNCGYRLSLIGTNRLIANVCTNIDLDSWHGKKGYAVTKPIDNRQAMQMLLINTGLHKGRVIEVRLSCYPVLIPREMKVCKIISMSRQFCRKKRHNGIVKFILECKWVKFRNWAPNCAWLPEVFVVWHQFIFRGSIIFGMHCILNMIVAFRIV